MRKEFLTCTGSILATLVLAGCSFVDQVGVRPVDYNVSMAEAKVSNILLNIVRAAYAEPLQFSEVTTLAGQATMSGQLTSAFPLPLNQLARNASQTATLTPQLTTSAQSTVNVGNLNTQEFYNELQTPISMQQISFYMQYNATGLNAYQLLPLLVSKLEITSATGETYLIENSGASQASFAGFYTAVAALIDQGLYVESLGKKTPSTVGPLLSESDIRDPRVLAALISPSGTTGLTVKEETVGATTGYRLKKDEGDGGFRFCFRQVAMPYGAGLSRISVPKSDFLSVPLIHENGAVTVTARIGAKHYCRQGKSQSASNSGSAPGKQQAGENITITTRSLEGVIHFLGEMVRTELGLGDGRPVSLAIPTSQQTSFRLFHVEAADGVSGGVSARHSGSRYSIIADVSGQHDTSSRILQLLSDLLALQSSAKNFPTPNVITLSSP